MLSFVAAHITLVQRSYEKEFLGRGVGDGGENSGPYFNAYVEILPAIL
jgi:hypothetical protein